jgi:hypothetical protein
MRLLIALLIAALALSCTEEPESEIDWRAVATAQGLTLCGDGTCDETESCVLCPSDCTCTGGCGDGVCDVEEGCFSCAADCGACDDVCGDERCGGFENCEICAADCGACGSGCGDGRCTEDESCSTCPTDCGGCELPVCGDGDCVEGEGCASCPDDCGLCPDVCGDEICGGTEDCGVCEADCGVCTWPADQARAEDELLDLVNNLRTNGGSCPSGSFGPMAPLVVDESLRLASRLHSQDLGESRYFDHTSLDGRSPFQRMIDAGYTGQPRGENIAGGSNTAQGTFQQWLGSDGHCRNMFNPGYDEIGIGYAVVPGSPFTHYWTQTFGVR